MTWRDKKRKINRTDPAHVILYMSYLAYEGIYDSKLHLSEENNMYFKGSMDAFQCIKKFNSTNDLNMYNKKLKKELKARGAHVANGYIEFSSGDNPLSFLTSTDDKPESKLWELVGSLCATTYMLEHLKSYNEG